MWIRAEQSACRHVPPEPTAKYLAIHGCAPKTRAAESREKAEGETTTFNFANSPVYKLVQNLFSNGIKMHSRGAGDGSVIGSV